MLGLNLTAHFLQTSQNEAGPSHRPRLGDTSHPMATLEFEASKVDAAIQELLPSFDEDTREYVGSLLTSGDMELEEMKETVSGFIGDLPAAAAAAAPVPDHHGRIIPTTTAVTTTTTVTTASLVRCDRGRRRGRQPRRAAAGQTPNRRERGRRHRGRDRHRSSITREESDHRGGGKLVRERIPAAGDECVFVGHG